MEEGQKMTNTEFDYTFNGKVYKVKKASLKQVMVFQRKVDEITKQKDPAGDLMMAAYAIFLTLNAIDKNITEEEVLEHTPGDIDVMDVFATLGFMSQQKVAMMTKIRNSLENLRSGEESSAL
jgi:hypothetical protein